MESNMRRRRRRKVEPLALLIPVLVCIVIALFVVALHMPGNEDNPSLESTPGNSNSTNSTNPTTQPSGSTEPSGTTQPSGSTEPSGTTQPSGSTEPSGTTQPSGSTEPSGTTQPSGSTEPSGTTQPSGTWPEADLEAFFSESVFIGDSVTLALRNYCMSHSNALYGAKILCAGSYAVRHAITEPNPNDKNIVSITYQGVGVRPEDALAQIGAKRVFIMLGMNDIAFGVDYTIGNWKTLINNIRAKCPDIEIYIQSATPIHATKDKDGYKLNNANMDIYNTKLENFCQENGCYFVELNSYFKDANGDLADQYCSDPYSSSNPNGQGCHFTTAGVELWIRLVKEFVSNQ